MKLFIQKGILFHVGSAMQALIGRTIWKDTWNIYISRTSRNVFVAFSKKFWLKGKSNQKILNPCNWSILFWETNVFSWFEIENKTNFEHSNLPPIIEVFLLFIKKLFSTLLNQYPIPCFRMFQRDMRQDIFNAEFVSKAFLENTNWNDMKLFIQKRILIHVGSVIQALIGRTVWKGTWKISISRTSKHICNLSKTLTQIKITFFRIF